MNAQEILTIIQQNKAQYNYFGLRAMTPNAITREPETAVIGEPVNNSFNWVDGVTTDEMLNGVCALSLDYDFSAMEEVEQIKKVNDVIQDILGYAMCTNQVVLIGSMKREYGEDWREIIMFDRDIVLQAWNI